MKVLATEVTFSTVERRAYAEALAKLTGVNHGTRLRKWRAYWAKHGARLLGQRSDSLAQLGNAANKKRP